jgi:hypothetical protein
MRRNIARVSQADFVAVRCIWQLRANLQKLAEICDRVRN